MTGDERRVIGGQEQHALRDLDGLPHPAERMETMHRLANRLGMPKRARDQRRVNDPGWSAPQRRRVYE